MQGFLRIYRYACTKIYAIRLNHIDRQYCVISQEYHFVEINKMIESRVSSGFASGLGFFNNLEEVSPFCIAER